MTLRSLVVLSNSAIILLLCWPRHALECPPFRLILYLTMTSLHSNFLLQQMDCLVFLAATKKGSLLRSQILYEMIKRGYDPVSSCTPRQLVQSQANGKVIMDVEWESQVSKSPSPEI